MTITGIAIWAGTSLAVIVLAMALGYVGAYYDTSSKITPKGGLIRGLAIGIVLSIAALFCAIWYYTNTASGRRELKTQRTNLSNGVERVVHVYSAHGELIKVYTGKMDVVYDESRILFDDENGLRHIIYYPSGTVLIDEIKVEKGEKR